MNIKSLIVTILVAFIAVWVMDFLIHGVWLSSTYGATKELWRPEEEMVSKMPWMFAGQFLSAAAFTVIFALCVAPMRRLSVTLIFAACIGVLTGAGQLIMYAVQPLPGTLIAQWCVAGLAQSLVLGLIVHKVYRPPGV